MQRAVFLDRDGVVVRAVIVNGQPRSPLSPEEFQLLPQVQESLLDIKQLGFLAILVSNQPDVANGNVTEETWSSLQSQIEILPFNDIYICRHRREDNCDCKKPKAGMLYAAAEKWGIDLGRSYIIGDTESDMLAGKTAGCKGILIDMPYNQSLRPDLRASTLYGAVQLIEGLERKHRYAYSQ